MSEHDRTAEDCLFAYRDGDYQRCADLAQTLLDRRQAPFVISQILMISLQRSGREDDANATGRYLIHQLASKPWLKALVQVTLGQEPPDLRPPDDPARCQLLYYRGARCRTLGEDDRALDLFESAARLPVSITERDLARHEANELAIVVDGESGAGWEEEADLDEDERATSHSPVPPPIRGRGAQSRAPIPFPTPPPAPSRIPPPRATPAPAPPRSMPPAPAPFPASSVPPPVRMARPEPLPPTDPYTLPEIVRRHATVRYYRRMHPHKLYPLLVVLSVDELRSLVQSDLDQAATDGVVMKTDAAVVIEPVLPGCTVYPPRLEVRIGADDVTQAHFRVLALLPRGRIDGASVFVRQGNVDLAEIPLRMRVGKPTLAYTFVLASMGVPVLLQYFQLDLQTQAARSFAGYTDIIDQVFATPWWAWSAVLVTLALIAAWWTWPRQHTFWNIEMATAPPR